MKQITMVAICLVFAAVAGNAYAHDDEAGWRLGASAVTTKLKRDDDIVNNSSLGFKAFAQYKFGSWFGFEGAFYNSLDLNSDATSANGQEVELAYRGPIFQGIGYMPVPWEEMEFFIKAGYFDLDVELVQNGVNMPSGRDSGVVLGAGLSFHINDKLHFRTEFDWFDAQDAELWTVGLGLEYHF